MLQRFCGLVYLSALSQLCLRGTLAKCPLQITPQSVVVKYGDPVSVNCSTSVTHMGMGWESTVGGVPLSTASLITWRVSELTDWEIQPPFCYINYGKQCEVALPVTVYKTPDSVSISTVNPTMKEGNQYELQCDVHNVAPVQKLTVNWYKGETLVDQTNFTDTIKSPVSKTSKLLICPDRADDGAQYRCEAELNLGEEGPQPPPTNTSEPLRITVYYKPKHSNSTEIISWSNDVSLNCTVKANPAAVYSWHSEHLTEKISSSVIQSSTLSPGNYTCIATNFLGEDKKNFTINCVTGCHGTFWTVLVFPSCWLHSRLSCRRELVPYALFSQKWD